MSIKKLLLILLCLGLVVFSAFGREKPLAKLVVYDEPSKDEKSIYVPSGWMGDYGAIKLDNSFNQNPYSGHFCQQWIYSGLMPPSQGWTGVYWQYPPDNWGSSKGMNLSGYTKFTFWARGQIGTEIVSFQVGGIKGNYPDTLLVKIQDVQLTKEWQQYTIDLFGKDLSNVSGGFAWVVSREKNPRGCVFYLDKILYE
ncbi:MAG: hypothetical protein ABIA97_02855 [Candidatus Omnitrophota bacterium]